MRKVTMVVFGVVCLAMCQGQSGCESRKTEESVSGAKQVSPVKVPLNSRGNTVEQQNIQDRLAITNEPTKVMWIHLIALDGKIIRRMPVACKVTSSNKRLEPKHYVADGTNITTSSLPSYKGFLTDEAIGPDGTRGESDPYIFWLDPMGRYHQYGTAGGIGYLLTDYPIDLANPIDEVTGMYNMNEAAHKWQLQQEALLKIKEDKLKVEVEKK